MSEERPYYEAYDERYRTMHLRGECWFGTGASPIVGEVLERYGIRPGEPLLELGCGEGRDAIPLLEQGYDLLATDVSPEAIRFCRTAWPDRAGRFAVLDAVRDRLDRRFRFIGAVAVIHMLVPDADRAAFYRFIREHLSKDGIGLLCSMGDGQRETASDISRAFSPQEREHEGQIVTVAGTSCRMVSWDTWEREMARAGLIVREKGMTSVPGEFPEMMYAVVAGQEPPFDPPSPSFGNTPARDFPGKSD